MERERREREREIQSLSRLSIREWVRSAIHASQQPTSSMAIFETTALSGTTGIRFKKQLLNLWFLEPRPG